MEVFWFQTLSDVPKVSSPGDWKNHLLDFFVGLLKVEIKASWNHDFIRESTSVEGKQIDLRGVWALQRKAFEMLTMTPSAVILLF